MQKEPFRVWMQQLGTMNIRPICDAISRCKRIQDCLGLDLDEEYSKDGGRKLISLLEYTAEDVRQNRPVPSGLTFKPNSNIRNGMASLKSAAKKYFEFCQSIK